ncbi:MAG: hypothetical protein ACI8S6_003230, partial [Myxococcota bacterium]
MFFTILLAAALASPVESADATPAEEPQTLDETWELLGPDALSQQALGMQAEGRRAAALERLAWLSEQHPDPLITFHIGKTLELD